VIHRLAAALLLLAACVALAACGEVKDPSDATPPKQTVDLALDFFPNADHAGIYAGIDGGSFKRAGLNVKIRVPSDPAAPLKLLNAGKVDLAISYEPEVLLARDKGAKVVSVGAIVQQPLTSIISIGKKAIKTPAQLDGKTVGTAGIPYQDAYLQTILDEAGIDPKRVKKVNVGFNLVPAMLTKKVDATLGGFWNYEGIQLAREKKHPRIIRVDRAGVPPYDELVLVARASYLRDHGPTVRRFLQALAQGTKKLRTDPTAGVDPLLQANKDLDRGLQLASVKATLPAFFPASESRPFGWQDPRQWEAYGKWMLDNELITQPPAPGSLTNEFLPGEGV
jgi:putative hydroxymethylpyrimidine transport system substrate-binding protein